MYMTQKFTKTLVVRITPEQYVRLLEAIVAERKKGVKSSLTKADKSAIIREMINKYTSGLSYL
jgi:hypothetical protein